MKFDAKLALKLLNDLDQEEEAFTRWTYSEGYPPDGDYWCRADVDDQDVMRIGIRGGEARDHTGMRKIIYGYEWKLRPPLPPARSVKGRQG